MDRDLKKQIKLHLSYRYVVYIILAIVIIALWALVYNAIGQPADNEKISIFAATTSADSDKLHEVLDTMINKETGIKEINIDYYNPNDTYYSMVFSTRGTIGTDILIMPESQLSGDSAISVAAAIDTTTLEYILGDLSNYEFLTIEDKIYGIKLFDHTKPESAHLGKYFVYDLENTATEGTEAAASTEGETEKVLQDYYLLFNASSVNIGSLSYDSKASDSDVMAIEAVRMLFAAEKGE